MVISDEVAQQTAQRIVEHARRHALRIVQVVLHGGEPLLAGRSRLERIITALRAATDGVCQLDMRIHTNGVMLSEAFCELFARHQVKVGISLDGDRAANDRHRRYADGRSSYDKVLAAIGLLRTARFQDLYAGLLCTIDVANDPLAVYDSLVALAPPRIDFLLPHATWDAPPARNEPGSSEYADWLIAIYDRWTAQGRPVQIRTFDSVLSTLADGPSFTEALGLEPTTLAVIETDGSYEQVDSLKAAFDGAPETGTNVFDHDLDTVARHPGIRARQQGIAGLCKHCRQCPVVSSCGGGLYTHRYRTGNGFDNTSVYCADLLKLITHIGSRPPQRHPRAYTCRRRPGSACRGHWRRHGHDAARRCPAKPAAGLGGFCLPGGKHRRRRDGRAGPERRMVVAHHARPHAAEGPGHCPTPSICSRLGHAVPRTAESLPPPARRRGTSRDLASDLGHLGALAAAAAVRARIQGTVTVPVVNSAVHLPTLGRLTLAGQQDDRSAAVGPQTASVTVLERCRHHRGPPRAPTLSIRDLLTYMPGMAADDGPAGNGSLCGSCVRQVCAWRLRISTLIATAINGLPHPG